MRLLRLTWLVVAIYAGMLFEGCSNTPPDAVDSHSESSWVSQPHPWSLLHSVDAPWALQAYSSATSDRAEELAFKARGYYELDSKRGGYLRKHSSSYRLNWDSLSRRYYYPVYEILSDSPAGYQRYLVGNRPQSYLIEYEGSQSPEPQGRTIAKWSSTPRSCPVFTLDHQRRLVPFGHTNIGSVDVLQVGTDYARVKLDTGQSAWISRHCLQIPLEPALNETTRVQIPPRMPTVYEASAFRREMHRYLDRYIEVRNLAAEDDSLRLRLNSLLDHIVSAPYEPFGAEYPILLPGYPMAEIMPTDMYFLLSLLRHSRLSMDLRDFNDTRYVSTLALATAEEPAMSFGLLPIQDEQAAMWDAMAVLFGTDWPLIAVRTTAEAWYHGKEADYALDPLQRLPASELSWDDKVARVMANLTLLLDLEMLWYPGSPEQTFRPGTEDSARLHQTVQSQMAHTHPFDPAPISTEHGPAYGSQRGQTVMLRAPAETEEELVAHGHSGDLTSEAPIFSTIVTATGERSSIAWPGTSDASTELLLRTPVGRVRTRVKWFKRQP